MPAIRFIILLGVLGTSLGTLRAQDFNNRRTRKLNEAALRYFEAKDVAQAINTYHKVLVDFPENGAAHKGLGEVYLELGKMDSAHYYYKQALSVGAVFADQDHFNYAEALLGVEEYLDAREHYELYFENNKQDKIAAKRISSLNHFVDFFLLRNRYDVQELPMNSTASDVSPSFYNDGFLFLSGRDQNQEYQLDRTRDTNLDYKFSNFDTDGDPGPPANFLTSLGSKYSEGPVAFNSDQTVVIFTHVAEESETLGGDPRLELYSMTKNLDGEWSKPIPLSINGQGHSVAHPTLSSDGKILYFASNQDGGYGGMDIYRCDMRSGRWGQPYNMGPVVNTTGDEVYPFIHEDEKLYFSSNGHEGLGGLDIYSVEVDDLKGIGITNLGFPLNSSMDDFGFILDPSGKQGYFASTRPGGLGEEDIYRVAINNDIRPQPLFEEELEPQVQMANAETDVSEFVPSSSPVVAAQPDVSAEMAIAQSVVADEVLPFEKNVGFTVQILASADPDGVKAEQFRGLSEVKYFEGKDGVWRYTVGVYSSRDEAQNALGELFEKGYHDAFVRGLNKYEEMSIQKLPVALETIDLD
ncbi:MAG: SPOR domain-containing protein [Bacteroidota bacterium]